MDIQYDVIIIGAGPSGMTAAIYATRAGLKTAMLEFDAPGGKMVKTYEIENFPSVKQSSGVDLASKMFEHSTKFGAQYLYGKVSNITDHNDYKEITCEDGKMYTCKAIIIATGTKEKQMDIPGEKELTGHGVSYCAVCDGAFFKEKDVAVIGGGNAATEEAIYLTQFVKKLYIIIRRDVFRAADIAQKKIESNPKIEIITKHVPVEVVGQDKVSGLVIENVDTKEKQTLDVQGIFPYIGALPSTSFAKDLNILDEKGYIITNEKMETSVKGIYAAGDCIVKELRQVVTACNDGAIAAQNVSKYLRD